MNSSARLWLVSGVGLVCIGLITVLGLTGGIGALPAVIATIGSYFGLALLLVLMPAGIVIGAVWLAARVLKNTGAGGP